MWIGISLIGIQLVGMVYLGLEGKNGLVAMVVKIITQLLSRLGYLPIMNTFIWVIRYSIY